MNVDRQTGAVTLPNGWSAGPSLTQEGFRSGEMFPGARGGGGVPPWIHYRFSGGRVEGKELLVSLCFYDEMLVSLSVTVDHYPPGPRDWSDYSLDVEAAAKDFHDRLLEDLLGGPTESSELSTNGLTEAQATLARPRRWILPWGKVLSSHDQKGGGTAIIVLYGDRQEEANRLFRSHRA